jgi:two-component system, NarL family, response regulator NreC
LLTTDRERRTTQATVVAVLIRIGDMRRRSLLLADDHILVRHGIKMILSARSDFEVIGEVGDGLELLRILNQQHPDVVLLDISMPNLRGIEAIPEIRRIRPETRILILTMHREKEFMYQAIAAGADGYLLKEDADKDLFAAIDTILEGKIYVSRFLAEESWRDWADMHRFKKAPSPTDVLTVREREVVKLIAEGKSSKEIGTLLCISVRTVERHRANIMHKLSVRTTVDLVKYALRKGYA